MPNQELLNFIRESKKAGQTDEQIKSTLLANGWKEADINKGFQAATGFGIEPEKKSYKKLIFSVVIVVILLAGGAFGYYKYVYNKPTETVNLQPTSLPPVASSTTIVPATNTNCDNYQCLISAASQCQPISVTISYSGISFPFNPDMFVSGQTKYEVKKSSGVNDCILTFSSPVTSLSISDKGRKTALASGTTDVQITAQLQTMNNSLKSTAGTQTTCPSNANAISAFLTDMKNGNEKINSTGQTITYTNSSGQKLVCTVTLPAGQPANTSKTITDQECAAQKGNATAIANDGTACSKNQTDLGTIIGNLKLNDKYPQCCAAK